jgi:hypothetical protein
MLVYKISTGRHIKNGRLISLPFFMVNKFKEIT